VLTTQATLHLQDSRLGILTLILLPTAWVITLLTPSITAVVAAALTSRDMRGEALDLLRVTPLSESALIQGYVFAALHRMRVLLALAVGLMPALVIGMLQLGIVVAVIFFQVIPVWPGEPYYGPPPYEAAGAVADTLIFAAITIGMWGANVLAATLGMGLALRWQGKLAAIIVAPPITFLITLALPVLPFLSDRLPQQLLITLFSLFGPYVLAAMTLRWAQRWVQRSL
jgi:hypothetical protein